jgi:LytS/YehU family sensor histidine kinase
VEPDVEKAKVPPLILQPLVENAIKHGVSRVSGPQQISIHARKTAEGQLQVDVENAVPANTLPAPIGLGVGLVNVHGRLQVRFPGLASCTEHAPTHGRKRVTIQMPLVT